MPMTFFTAHRGCTANEAFAPNPPISIIPTCQTRQLAITCTRPLMRRLFVERYKPSIATSAPVRSSTR